MSAFLFPLIFILSSAGLFFGYIGGAYDKIDILEQDAGRLDQALTRAKELTELRNAIIARYNTLSAEQLSRLEKLLPDNVDNIRLIIDVDSIAKARGVKISDFGFAGDSQSGSAAGTASSQQAGGAEPVRGVEGDSAARGLPALPYDAISLTFSAEGSYEDFLAFLGDLEKSLRIVNIKSITLEAEGVDSYAYTIIMETYWLK